MGARVCGGREGRREGGREGGRERGALQVHIQQIPVSARLRDEGREGS